MEDMEEPADFHIEFSDELDEHPAPLRSHESFRGSMADKGRPDHFQMLLKLQQESHRVLAEENDDDNLDIVVEEDELDDGSMVDKDGETFKSPRQNAKILRQMTQKFNLANDTSSSDAHVEVRLHDVSYHVPIYTDEPDIPSVWNQTFFYTIFQVFRRFFNYMMNVGRDYSQILRPVEKKAILRNANLILKPGKSYVILGPPGCGKTTLLQVIGGVAHQEYEIFTGDPIRDKSHVSGSVRFNGLSHIETPEMILENVVSYVEQLDYHEPLLTVKETFEFARQCRCGVEPKDGTNAETGEKKVSENLSIDGLGLSHVADTYVGDSNIRGCSGGQRRRVTVGEMMQGQNPVACADEISTGLDSASTYDMIRSIVYFAKAAKTTRIVSLLQPGPETFSLFDETIILSNGLVIYAGPIKDVQEYFEDLGYIKPLEDDLADFLQSVSTMDGANMMDPLKRPDGHLTSEEFAMHWNNSAGGKSIIEGLESALPNRWTVSDSHSPGDAENPTERSIPLPENMKKEYQNTAYASMKLIFNRTLTVWKRNRIFIIAKIIENVGVAGSLGGLLFQKAAINYECDPDNPGMFIGDDGPFQVKTVRDAVYGGFFLFTFQILQGNTMSVPDVFAARRVHYKQTNANFYQDISFIVGRLLATWPMRLIETVSFGIPFYFILGLDLNVVSVLLYLCMTLLYMIFANILFLLIIMSAPTAQLALRAAIVVLFFMCLFGGLIVLPISFGSWIKWVYYMNPLAWVYKGFLTIEFTSSKYDSTRSCKDGLSYLSSRGFDDNRNIIGWSFFFIILITIATTIALALISKYLRFQEINSAKILEEAYNNEEQRTDVDDAPFTKINLTFENICYDVKASTGDDTLRLLDNVSGAMMAGRMCALMGSSGAGKTTLMDVISLRKTSGEISGTVELNGFAQETTSFLRSSGYVEQFDVQTSQLTVRETVVFSARLRLDSRNEATKSDASKLLFVDKVLEMLELTSLKNQQVGDLEIGKGLSFEQRKRLAIAVELAGSPSILFLDEPTSGLDSRGALVVMRAMKRIADTGRTICATIHQPSSAVFAMFDDLLLLKKGGTLVFFGDLGKHSINLTSYFETAGSEPIQYGQNPASWMLLASEFREPVEWAELYTSSNQYNNLMEQIRAERESLDEAKKITYAHTYATTLKDRLVYLTHRINLILRRSPAYNLGRMFTITWYGLLLALIFAGKQNTHKSTGDVYTENDMDGIFGTIFLALNLVGFTMIMMVIPEVKKIRDVFYKHKASGMMAHHAVFFAIIMGEIAYLAMVTLLFCIAYFFLLGLFNTALKFLQFWGFFLLNLAIYTYFGQLFACLVPDIPTAMTIGGSIITINLFGSGFLIKPFGNNIMRLITFYISPGHYCFEGILMSQFKDLTQEVIPVEGSDYFSHLLSEGGPNCQDMANCSGTMESYTDFNFGNRFSLDNQLMDALIPISYLVVVMFATHWTLGHLTYTNT